MDEFLILLVLFLCGVLSGIWLEARIPRFQAWIDGLKGE